MNPNVYVLNEIGSNRHRISSISKFPAGELRVHSKQSDYTNVEIVAHIQSSDDVMSVLMLNDALKRQGHKVQLFMPYVPYARQDRVCNEGEALSIKVFCELINSCNFEEVHIYDPHSDVTPALLNNVVVYYPEDVIPKNLIDWSDFVLVAPDAGALKRTERFAKHVGAKAVVVANKKRDLKTGHIEYVKLTESVDGENVFVMDDILEGGGTFFLLAEQLQNAKLKFLYVTHGIFSNGFDILKKYDMIYTTNSYHPNLEFHDNLHVFKI